MYDYSPRPQAYAFLGRTDNPPFSRHQGAFPKTVEIAKAGDNLFSVFRIKDRACLRLLQRTARRSHVSARSGVDRESFQEFLASAFAVQDSQIDSRFLTALLAVHG